MERVCRFELGTGQNTTLSFPSSSQAYVYVPSHAVVLGYDAQLKRLATIRIGHLQLFESMSCNEAFSWHFPENVRKIGPLPA